MKIPLPDDIRIRFRNFINSRTGLYFRDYDLKDLDGVIAKRMEACSFDTALAYYSYLTSSENKEAELRELLNRLTVNHTYFFRNEPQFKALKDKILPELIERKIRKVNGASQEKPVIRIWSAGCSSGEEPYSIAMVIKDLIPDLENWDVHILATDASAEALQAAQKGVYGANSLRLVDKDHMERYFTRSARSGREEKYEISLEIKKMVNFGFFNLIDEDYPQGFDIIFCRNVTIYFELETTIRVMNKFAASLDDDGYVFIGYSETLQFISDKLKMVDWEDAIFYVKAKEGAERPRFRPAPLLEPPRRAEEIFQELSKLEFKADEKIEKIKRSPELDKLIIQAIETMHAKNYEGALALIRKAKILDENDIEPYYLEAEVYADQGRFGEAKESLNIILSKDAMFAPAHYLLGSIYADENAPDEAERSFKKALYIEKEFSLAHMGLASVYKQRGRFNAALREYRNTLNILSKAKAYDIIAHSGGFNAATLSSVCKNNIELLKIAE